MTVSNFLLANIGHRDIQLDGQFLSKPKENYRKFTRSYVESWSEYGDRIAFPILAPVLAHIAARAAAAPLNVVLFATDQDDVGNQPGDTLHAAECIRKKLVGAAGIAGVEVVLINDPPNRHDRMYDWYSRWIEGLKARMAGQEAVLYVAGAGGTPACNMALMFHAIRLFHDGCVPLYTVEGREEAVALSLGRQVTDTLLRERAASAINKYDYATAATLFGTLEQPLHAALANAAACRQNFDFKGAVSHLEKVDVAAAPAMKEQMTEYRASLDKCAQGNGAALLNELYMNLRALWRRGEYVDFIGRLYRLLEAALKYMLARPEVLGLNIHHFEESAASKPELIKYLRDNDYVQASGPNGRRGKIRLYVPLMIGCLDYAIWQSDGRDTASIERFKKACENLMWHHDLRNESLAGHGFHGVSKKNLTGEKQDFPFAVIDELFDAAGIERRNTYDPMQKMLKAGLQA